MKFRNVITPVSLYLTSTSLAMILFLGGRWAAEYFQSPLLLRVSSGAESVFIALFFFPILLSIFLKISEKLKR